MKVVRDVKEFALMNESALKKFMKYKTSIYDEDTINEYIQEFYLRLITTKSLERFDSSLLEDGNEQKLFDQYVCTLFCWMLPVMYRKSLWHELGVPDRSVPAAKRRKVAAEIISEVPSENRDMLPHEIWDHVTERDGRYKIENGYKPSVMDSETDDEEQRLAKEFMDYINRTEPRKRAHRMIVFVDHRMKGCNAVDVSVMLGISSNMVKLIKRQVREKYESWIKSR